MKGVLHRNNASVGILSFKLKLHKFTFTIQQGYMTMHEGPYTDLTQKINLTIRFHI